ncbi:MAG: SDR family NAD(P)-dependent oxidoreductase [Treponema sp.]|jgi:NAD(P)-dependent dehydrogenase (short-subunit alcohol dehydrogenase family)|nr:SDR family NAD(P)-dependent oxidoreductase [Treponema sp.]
MESKIILITGATSGIGKAAAKALAQQGHTVILHGRNKTKTESLCEEIKSESGNTNIDILLGDMFLLSDVKKMADEFKAKYQKLDVLINNAGGTMGKTREVTNENMEKTIVLNLLAPFLLTELLLGVMAQSSDARIINVSSEMHKFGGKPLFDDFQLEQNYDSVRAYGLAKLYLIWISRHLAADLKQKNMEHITVNTVHPGVSNTNFGLDADRGFFTNFIGKLLMAFSLTPEQGAESVVYLASSDDVKNVTGKYYAPKKKLAKASDKYYSAKNESIVWDYCMKICEPYLR